ncbi:MAG: hypothetical protein WCA56_00090 [Xanthobacteraceae bacterium]
MPRPETEPVAGRDGGEIAQHAVVEAIGFYGAGIFRLARFGMIAACDQKDDPISRRGAHLVRINAHIEIVGLRDRRAHCAVGVKAVDSDRAWIVVSRQQKRAAGIDARVNRTRRQCSRIAQEAQCACRRIDRERIGEVPVAGNAGPAIARYHVKRAARRMRPGILNIGRQHHRVAFSQCGFFDINIVAFQRGTDAGVENCFWHDEF